MLVWHLWSWPQYRVLFLSYSACYFQANYSISEHNFSGFFLSLTLLTLFLLSLSAKYPSDLTHSSRSNCNYFISKPLNGPHYFSVVKHVHTVFT